MLSSELQLKAAVSGWLLGFVGTDYAIFRRSEIHFMSVHPMHLAVFDLKHNRSVEIYPFAHDLLRREFSRLIEPHISEKWCLEFNAQCDSDNFDVDLQGSLAINEAAGVFAFTARFDAAGFGDAAETQVQPVAVVYAFRLRGARWEHREFAGTGLERLLNGGTLDQLIANTPDLPFEHRTGK